MSIEIIPYCKFIRIYFVATECYPNKLNVQYRSTRPKASHTIPSIQINDVRNQSERAAYGALHFHVIKRSECRTNRLLISCTGQKLIGFKSLVSPTKIHHNRHYSHTNYVISINGAYWIVMSVGRPQRDPWRAPAPNTITPAVSFTVPRKFNTTLPLFEQNL